ncbi:MAG: FG-GAP-like repeat-containing protein, partial [Gemmatimonadota bacterium]
HGRVHLIAGIVARQRDRPDRAVEHLRTAVTQEPDNLRAMYVLARLLERLEGADARAEARRMLDRVVAIAPENSFALLERARLAAAQSDAGPVLEALDRLTPTAAVTALEGAPLRLIRQAVDEGAFDRALAAIEALQARLQRDPGYRDDRDALQISTSGIDIMLTRFVRLPAPAAHAAPPDLDVTFAAESLSVGTGSWDWVRGLWLADEVPVALIAANAREISIGITVDQLQRFEFPGGAASARLDPSALTFLDYDYDFRMDLAFAGAAGIRLLRQDGVGTFVDVTRDVIPTDVVGDAFTGVWAADLDMEGDMDLVLARETGEPLVLWNLGDERFQPGTAFPGVERLRAFEWADLDGDGDPDAALIDAEGRLHVFLNRRFRTPRFEAVSLPDEMARARAVVAADLDRDAKLDLVTLQADGTVRHISTTDDGWTSTVIAEWPDLDPLAVGTGRLYLADLDNNGDLDLVVSVPYRTRTWLSTPDGYRPHQSIAGWTTDVTDITGEGRLDLVAVGEGGDPALHANEGRQDYYATSLRPRAARSVGDRRINSFGLGGEIEVRAALLYQKQPITRPTVHFGLGDHGVVDVARISWPNGSVQAEFGIDAANVAVSALQRLKGSCPWLYAYNGDRVEFVTDFIWRTALGLRINAQGDASVIHAEDRVRIRGDQLAPRDGYYDIRITGELWESHFFDQVELMAVDHPVGSEVFVDERFTLPAPEPAVHVTGPLQPVISATDQDGRDVTDRVAALDERYLDTFELRPYQGLAEDHFVEVDLGDDALVSRSLWLVASGWVYPTDGSINFALAQAGRPGPRGLRVQVPDGRGGWATLHEDYGFPAGKTKTLLLDLTDAFRPGTDRRVRLGTNMEIYWDRIAWAEGRPDGELRTTRIPASSVELRYYGFSEVHADGRRAPELPTYGAIAAVTPQWRDLEGYHTRYGDVRPLVLDVDDRYVIMNAGDELAFRFPALPPPPDGWTRDFVLIGDGWVKDGDYNNGFSRTLRPLPYHGLTDYDVPPGRLEDDPAYRRHPDDWRTYHTRYITPAPFREALLPPAP